MKEDIREVCRKFRKKQTKAEKAFWEKVRNRQIDDCKILRQYPIKFEWDNKIHFFISDFYCNETKLVIEIDGGIHESQKDYDKMREKIINQLGYRIIRFSNEDVLNNLDYVLMQLRNVLLSNN